MKIKATEEDQATARFLADLTQLFLDLRETMTVRAINAYGLVGWSEGHSVQHYALIAKAAPGTMSRSLLDIGPRNRWGQPGEGLVDSHITYRNQKAHHLTPEGIELLRKIATLRQTGENRNGR